MPARKSGLGRGLDALLAAGRPTGGFAMLPVDAVDPNPDQPRDRFTTEPLQGLADSIKEVGVLQPIVVRPAGANGRHVLVAGERRLRAARMAGLTEIPAVIRDGDDQGRLVEAVVENVQREDLDPLEEAAAYRTLMEDFGLSHEQVATKVGKSRSAVTNSVRLLGLPGAIQTLLVAGKISAGAARALLGTDDTAYAVRIANKAATEGWSVRQVEEAVRARQGGAAVAEKKPARVRKDRAAQIIALEERLGERLGSPVHIEYTRRGGGRMTIRFGSLNDLERIYRSLLGG
jgi:ParB family chromosome partitioning protein